MGIKRVLKKRMSSEHKIMVKRICAACMALLIIAGAASCAAKTTAEAVGTESASTVTKADEVKNVVSAAGNDAEDGKETGDNGMIDDEKKSAAQDLNIETENLNDNADIDAIIADMSVRQKVGQLFMIRPEALCLGKNVTYTELNDAMKANFENYPAGGIILFGQNITDEAQLIKFTDDIHSLYLSPLIAIDEEGGSLVRIASKKTFDVPVYPTMAEIAATGDPGNAYDMAFGIGSYLNRYGIDVNFAPVADVNTNPDNPIIGPRAFGDDPDVADEMVAAAIRGFHDAGIYCCVKHFPGHGDTSVDTHYGNALIEKTWDEMKECELIPFERGIEEGVDFVMIAHITVSNITGDDMPASISKTIVTDKLRGELGFDGVIVTDGLEMKAVSDRFGSGELAVLSVLAGEDIILVPIDYKEAFDAVLEAVNSGRISEERLDESVRRILRLKLIKD